MSRAKETVVNEQKKTERIARAVEDPHKVARYLSLYQQWRTGTGKFAWNEDPRKTAPMPFTPRQLSIIERAAIIHLKNI